MPDEAEALLEKIRRLPPRRLAEVEDFIDFLRSRDEDLHLTRTSTGSSQASFTAVWDNDEDAVYDRM